MPRYSKHVQNRRTNSKTPPKGKPQSPFTQLRQENQLTRLQKMEELVTKRAVHGKFLGGASKKHFDARLVKRQVQMAEITELARRGIEFNNSELRVMKNSSNPAIQRFATERVRQAHDRIFNLSQIVAREVDAARLEAARDFDKRKRREIDALETILGRIKSEVAELEQIMNS